MFIGNILLIIWGFRSCAVGGSKYCYSQSRFIGKKIGILKPTFLVGFISGVVGRGFSYFLLLPFTRGVVKNTASN